MTEEMSPEFEMFSQMLDEESGQSMEGFQADAELLLELRKSLRETPSELPSSFADETANLVKERYAQISPMRRMLDASRSLLLQNAFSQKALWKSLLLAAPLLGAALEPRLLMVYGSILGILGLAWLGQEKSLSDVAPMALSRKGRYPGLTKGLFYLFPLSSVVLFSTVVGVAIWSLHNTSLSFKDEDRTGALFGLIVGTGTFFLLLKSLAPLWQAYKARAGSSPIPLSFFQTFHAGLFGFLSLSLLSQLSPSDYDVSQSVAALTENGNTTLGVLGILTLALSLFINKHVADEGTKPSLPLAWKRTLSSLALGFIPIVLALVGFYQLHLTREIRHESYEYISRDVEAWEKAQMAVSPESNGWTLIRPYFLRTEQDKDPKNLEPSETIKALSQYYVPADEWDDKDTWRYRTLNPGNTADRRVALEKYSVIKNDFLALLPLLEEASSGEHFTTLPTEGFSLQSSIPDYLSFRAVAQNLSSLTNEALDNKDGTKALEYILTNLQWSSKGEPVSLIDQMIRIAMLRISAENIERTIRSGLLNDEQIAHLSQGLTRARPKPSDFSDSMKRETVMCERAFQKMASGEWSLDDLGDIGHLRYVAQVLPKSYWESERKAYLNYQLSRSDSWMTLSFQTQATNLDEEINPFNLASLTLVPNYTRAQAQFCSVHSQFTALILVTHLERYKLKYGSYPVSLEALVGEFFDELPEDLINERMRGKKEGFTYKLTESGYALTSTSEVYKTISYKAEQVYGDNEHFGFVSDK